MRRKFLTEGGLKWRAAGSRAERESCKKISRCDVALRSAASRGRVGDMRVQISGVPCHPTRAWKIEGEPLHFASPGSDSPVVSFAAIVGGRTNHWGRSRCLRSQAIQVRDSRDG